jgi:hypothetical protein
LQPSRCFIHAALGEGAHCLATIDRDESTAIFDSYSGHCARATEAIKDGVFRRSEALNEWFDEFFWKRRFVFVSELRS